MRKDYDAKKTLKKSLTLFLLGVVVLGVDAVVPIISLDATNTMLIAFSLSILKAIQDVAKHKYELIGKEREGFKW